MAVLAGEEQLGPRGAALLVVGPLHLVEDEHLALSGRHLDGAAEDRRVVVEPFLARDEADLLLAEQRSEPAMGLLREHPQRPRVDAAPVLGEERERVVRLAGVRRPEMRDDGLGRRPPLGEPDLDLSLGALHRGALVRARGACVPGSPGRTPRRARAAAARHRATVAAASGHVPGTLRPSASRQGSSSSSQFPIARQRDDADVATSVGTSAVARRAQTLRYRRSVRPEPRAPTTRPTPSKIRAMSVKPSAWTSLDESMCAEDRGERRFLADQEQDDRREGAHQAAEEALDHERPAHEPVGRADELHHLDLPPAREDREPDRVRDEEYGCCEEDDHRDEEDDLDHACDLEDPLRRLLPVLDAIDSGELLSTDGSRSCLTSSACLGVISYESGSGFEGRSAVSSGYFFCIR